MKSPRLLDRRIGFSVGALSVLFGTLAPAVVPAFASAAQLQSRSIQMSTSAQSATPASYKVTFTPGTTEATGDIVLWFCNNTPLAGEACTAPAGLSLSSATLVSPPGSEVIDTAGSYVGAGANYLVISGASLTASSAYTITVGNVTNPSGSGLSNGTFYGRIETIADDATAEAAGGDAAHGGTADGSVITSMADNGSVALAVQPTIGVTAAVLESMTFCVFGDPNNNTASTNGTADASGYLATLTTSANGPGLNCVDNSASNGGHSNGSPSPSVQLGQVSSNISALSTTTPSYAADWAQLSTNASSGAIVYLKTSNSCVGLHRIGQSSASVCDIPSAGATAGGSLTAGSAGFGLSFGSAVSAGTGSGGNVDINTNYGSGSYAMLGSGASNSASQGNAAEDGLVQDTTSTYGGYVFGTEGAPVSAMDIPFALGASISNNTPAGSYSTNLNLVAVGKF